MKILLADAQALYRVGLRQLLDEFSPDAEIEEVESFAELRERIEASPRFDLIVADLGFFDATRDGIRALVNSVAPAPLVVVASRESREDVARAIELGAQAFILKSSPPGIVLNVLRLVLAGGIYVPPSSVLENRPRAEAGAPLPFPARQYGLTGRQLEVLGLMAQGKTNRDIARALGLAEGTVKIHVTAILKALGVRNRTQAVIAAGKILKDARLKESS